MGVAGGIRALRERKLRIDPPLAGCLAWLVVLPLLAGLSAWTEPEEAGSAVAVPRAQPEAPAAQVRAVPISDLRPEPSAAMLTDAGLMRRELLAVARDVLGRPAGDRLLALAEQTDSLRDDEQQTYDRNPRYPYRYPKLDRLLDERLPSPLTPIEARRVNDLGVLLIHAATIGAPGTADIRFPQAGSAAFALLHRAAAGGACLPRLNLAFVVAADAIPRLRVAERVSREAARACPGDPTPLWLLGQIQSLQVAAIYSSDPPPEANVPSQGEMLDPPLATFRELRRQFPGSTTSGPTSTTHAGTGRSCSPRSPPTRTAIPSAPASLCAPARTVTATSGCPPRGCTTRARTCGASPATSGGHGRPRLTGVA